MALNRSKGQQRELPLGPPRPQLSAGLPKGDAPNQARPTVSRWTLPKPVLSRIISQKVSKMGNHSPSRLFRSENLGVMSLEKPGSLLT